MLPITPPISNFDRFASLLSPQQQVALAAIKGALQDDPTCLDTHHAGFLKQEQLEDKRDESI
jgi:hypothetical protein